MHPSQMKPGETYRLGKGCSRCRKDRWYYRFPVNQTCGQFECRGCGNGNMVIFPGIAAAGTQAPQPGGGAESYEQTEAGLLVPSE